MDARRAALHLALLLQQEVVVDTQISMAVAYRLLRRRRPRRRPRPWVRPWLTQERREQYGQYHTLMRELREEDVQSFQNYLWLSPEMFKELLHRVSPRIEKKDTKLRQALEPGLKLTVTLRHLASGDSYHSLAYDFRVPKESICLFVPEVCHAIVQEYNDEVIDCPTTQEEWQRVTVEFERRWNLPHACGALNGKHIAIRKPPGSGSLFHNYKGFFPIVLMALVDANYKFLWIDVGGL